MRRFFLAMLLILTCVASTSPRSVVAADSIEEAEFAYEVVSIHRRPASSAHWQSREWHRPNSIWA
jgi:hypothetical protein